MNKIEVVAVYSGENYHDINGVTYKQFMAEAPGTSIDGRLINLPTCLFPQKLKRGYTYSITLEEVR